MNPPTDAEIRDSLVRQAQSCASLGSPMYARLLDEIVKDFTAHGATRRLLHGRTERPVHDALPLRLLGAVHRLALSGRAPRIAARYPSCGGDGRDLPIEDFVDAIEQHSNFVRAALGEQVQTNEVGRSIVPLSIAQWLGNRGFTDFDHLEVGASAGLNLNFDSYSVITSSGRMGVADSDIEFTPDWFDTPPPIIAPPARVVSRVGSDPHPIDVRDPDQALRLLSFVWPDQTDRIERLRRAIDLARRQRTEVVRSSADDFLAERLGSPLVRTTVVFHSIVWQYLSPEVRTRVRDTIERAGEVASPAAPVVWARMEPAGAVADVQVDVMSRGVHEQHVLAEVGYHGRGLRWL